MPLVLAEDPTPVRVDPQGVVGVGDTRVRLASKALRETLSARKR